MTATAPIASLGGLPLENPREPKELRSEGPGDANAGRDTNVLVLSRGTTSLGGLQVEMVGQVQGQQADRLLKHLNLAPEGQTGRCPAHGNPCPASTTRENGTLLARCGTHDTRPYTLAETWLTQRAGIEQRIPTTHRLLSRCCYALLGHEAGLLHLDIRPLELPPTARGRAIKLATAFAEWEAARATCDDIPTDGRVVLSERLWAALAGLPVYNGEPDRKGARTVARWLIDNDVLTPAEPEGGDADRAWQPTKAYRRAHPT